MRDEIEKTDKVLLICSKDSLTRPGVENEIEEALSREAALGGRTIIVPIALDDFVFAGWAPREAGIANAIRRRAIIDFRGILGNKTKLKIEIDRIAEIINSDFPTIPISYISHVTVLDVSGKQARWIIKKDVFVNIRKIDKYTFDDIEVSGSISGISSPSGHARLKKGKTGAICIAVDLDREYSAGERFTVSVDMILSDSHTAAHENLRSRMVAPWQNAIWRVTLPNGRPASSIECYSSIGLRKTRLPITQYSMNMTDFGIEVSNPKMGAYYNLEWSW